MSGRRIIDNVKCCACGGPLANGTINFVCLPKVATWTFPIAINPVFGVLDLALAIVCDKCKKEKAEIKFAVQWEDSVVNVKYHPVEKLEDIPKLDPAQIGAAA